MVRENIPAKDVRHPGEGIGREAARRHEQLEDRSLSGSQAESPRSFKEDSLYTQPPLDEVQDRLSPDGENHNT